LFSFFCLQKGNIASCAFSIPSLPLTLGCSTLDGVVSSNQGTGLVEEARSGVSETLNKSFDYLFFQSIEHTLTLGCSTPLDINLL
jgi:hypothetical protein